MTEMQALQQLLAELESHRLTTILAPSRRRDRRDWDMLRVNVDVPPTWFRKFCNQHVSSRGVRRGKFDTKIRRANVLSVLTRLAEGKGSGSKYVEELRRIARSLK